MAHMNSKYDYDINKRLHKLPNKMHLQACIDGGNIYKNRKKYNRKVKHKNRFMSDLGYDQEDCMEYNKMLMDDFLGSRLTVFIDTEEHYFEWVNAIKEFNIRWCHGTKICDEYMLGLNSVSIRHIARNDDYRMQYSSRPERVSHHDCGYMIDWDKFLELLHTNKVPNYYYS